MNRSIRCAALLLAFATAGGTHPALTRLAAAQEISGLDRARQALPPAEARELARIAEQARARGLPPEPLVDKALEGIAKRVPADRVLAVVRARAEQLDHARALLGGSPAAADITATADALQRGVPDHAIRASRQHARAGEPTALAIHTLADLLERGVPVEHALDVLEAWRGRGAHAEDLPALPAAVERLIRDGELPETAAGSVAAAVRAGRNPATVRANPANVRRGSAGRRPPISPGTDRPDRPSRPGGSRNPPQRPS